MARVFLAEDPDQKYIQVELKPQSGSLILVTDDVLDDVKNGGSYFQQLLDDIEWSIGDLLEECFKATDSSDAKSRLQVVLGALADLRLRFEE